ncbi:MAG: flagellar motor protein MotB [Bacillota bacterium]|jgi:chemotaxis protein MotB|uniref:flagellar motor protein MotB n=1 Tax=Fictibacillus TaxID=1329200 RepID=UPI001E62C151|nr:MULTISPECIES: flagellar motor protein MotB [unclassified Fictibacillus]
MRQRKQENEEKVDESWLIPYADMLTLLLALFIVLFASSSIDAKKFNAMMISLSTSFGNKGVLNETKSYQTTSMLTEEQKSIIEYEKNELEKLHIKIENYINENGFQKIVQTKLSDDGLYIVIVNDILFDSGRGQLKMEAKKIIYQLTPLLITHPARDIIIGGHTDNVPIHNNDFRSNWELSMQRSLHVLDVVLSNKDLDPARFSIKAYGEHKPLESNSTSEGRAKNRRVEFLILPLQKE